MTSDLTYVIGSGISNKLLENTTLSNLITEDGEIKIYLNQVPDAGILRPYIVMRHLYGGEENKAPSSSFNATWLVYGVSDDQNVAQQLAGLIKQQLTNQTLVFVDSWINWAGITTTSIYSDVENIQNTQRYKVGEYYRVRGVK